MRDEKLVGAGFSSFVISGTLVIIPFDFINLGNRKEQLTAPIMMMSNEQNSQTGQQFTIAAIEEAHSRVKSGADFPQYIRDIIVLGVTGFETYVSDSHTIYHGADDYRVQSEPQYTSLSIATQSNKELFAQHLKTHQQGGSDYMTFCRQCAETGIEKWIVDLGKMTCTYYDLAGAGVLEEQIPG